MQLVNARKSESLVYYQNNRPVTALSERKNRFIWAGAITIAQTHEGAFINLLYRSDQANTILGTANAISPARYLPYGFNKSGTINSALGFTGQMLDLCTQSYPLGNGRRFYNPGLMRFFQPDALSPFGKGGCNGYAYCHGDPVNYQDPSGQSRKLSAAQRRPRTLSLKVVQQTLLASLNEIILLFPIAEDEITKPRQCPPAGSTTQR
ncbi:RHS repeat-associated core domain-containing protein [Pseudomonas sp. Teo4]|uniref:RHS repeat-associated core domain-containing protein n=1 Tax=Pseudomonas sp. Teo4 TaxID=3064528 RepID=UPI002ABD0502|nr:RHS repeat-associated core domain-containing protein [Pseudomonas sp. Teo4]MDZ3991558.1 hypothetical protein [Pseudomonas sp. Teo4]